MKAAGLPDRAAIEAFLGPRAEFAMFPLANLARYGMEGGNPFAVGFWVDHDENGAISDVLTRTEGGTVMPCLPSRSFSGAASALRGWQVTGLIGPRDEVRGLEAALGLAGTPRSLDHDEPHFLLDLDDLGLPGGPGRIVPVAEAPEAVIRGWMSDYEAAALNTPAARIPERVDEAYARNCRDRSHVVLMEGAEPLAMTGFNARLPTIVQVGGVYTPPALRGRGHARRALALHLAEARAAGVRRATLFSASDMAARAYRSVGFRQIGWWSLVILHEAETVGG